MTTLPPGSRLGAYEILGPLGAGGMGEVFRARDTKLDREVAIKILPEALVADPDREARFQREAKMLASLNHPNIAHLYGLEGQEGPEARTFLVMELVDGEDLSRRIAQGPMPIDEALAVARQIADALAAAHEHGIVHRDLKPANIKLKTDGTVKVLDFGLAKALVADAGSMSSSVSMSPTLTTPAMTAMGVVLGTAAYMAPEQAKGRPVDRRADIWAFGCVLYEMLSGRRPFDGDDVADVMATVLKSEPDWSALPASVPPSIRRLIQRCLEKDPRARVADIAVARFLLAESPPSPPVPAAGVRGRGWVVAAALGLAAVAVAVAVSATRAGNRQAPKAMRFSLATSAAAPFDPQGTDRDVAVSPDGTRIVYRAYVGTTIKLVLRPVDQDSGTVIDGTEFARSPFFSPDGKWIAFASAGSLKKVALASGAPVTLATMTGQIRGGAWFGNTIVWATTDASQGLVSVPAGGGAPTSLTKLDPAKGEFAHWHPSFLPDGRALLYTIMAATGPDDAVIALLDLTTKATTIVTRGGSQPQYADGMLLFSSMHGVRGARFDLATRQMRGDPVPVLEQVGVSVSGAANYSISDTGLLVYADRTTNLLEAARSLVWVSPDGREEAIRTDPRAFNDPRISADGRHALVEINDAGDDIWTVDLARGALTRQSFEAGEDETPVWAGDGPVVLYAATRTSSPRSIFRRRVDGVGGDAIVWTGIAHAHIDAVTRDGGTLILTTTEVAGAQTDLVKLSIADRTITPLVTSRFGEKDGRLSPDGRWLAYASDETGRDEIYAIAYPSLEGKTQVSTSGGAQPVWSKTGDQIFFRTETAMMAAAAQTGPPLSFGQPRRLFDDRYYSKGNTHTGYDVARDGRFLMVKDASAASQTPGAPPNLNVVVNWFEDLKARLK